MALTPERLAELREHYDDTSTADEMVAGQGRWRTDVDPDRMIATSAPARVPAGVGSGAGRRGAGQPHRADPPVDRGSQGDR